MAVAEVSEYTRAPLLAFGTIPIADEESWIGDQLVPITASHAETAALNARTRFVRIRVDSAAAFVYGDAPIAINGTHKSLAANQTEYFGVKGGKKFSFVAKT